jgi:hypothetical protein
MDPLYCLTDRKCAFDNKKDEQYAPSSDADENDLTEAIKINESKLQKYENMINVVLDRMGEQEVMMQHRQSMSNLKSDRQEYKHLQELENVKVEVALKDQVIQKKD